MANYYKEFIIDLINEEKFDERFTGYSDDGRMVVVIGPLAIIVKQSDDGLGVIIDVTDSKTYEKEIDTLSVWFEDLK